MQHLARPLPDSPALPPRRQLGAGWLLLAEPAATAGEQAPADSAAWLSIGAAQPAAAALAAAGLWRQGGPPRRFDADVWWYRLRFDAEAEHRGAATLGFDGLATLAEVRLNGETILRSRNMFRHHQVDVSGRLRERGNELLLRFDALDAALAQRCTRPRWRTPMVEHAQLRWQRTTLLGRTPGWSPPAAPVGPWQPVWLAAHGGPASNDPTPRPTGLRLHSAVTGNSGRLDVTVRWAGLPPQRLRAQLARGARLWQCVLTASSDGAWQGSIEVQPVDRWWPHTHGEPALYALRLVVEPEAGVPATLALGQVGFRSIAVDRGSDGEGFAIVVNDAPVFCRGACWTPLDSLRLHATPAQYQRVFERVRAAGMNMLRVGGTMVYESDAFLDACDAAGILLWQDLMFAGMDYPADDAEFAAEVDSEVAQQLARLQARPALASVCGNSEVAQQAAMSGAPRGLWSPALFHQQLPARVAELLPGAAYWPSSAHGGAFPFQPAAGTTSYYGVGAYRRALDDAATSGLRFASECLGFANIPDAAALDRLAGREGGGAALQPHQPAWKARVPRDLGAGWDFDDVRDHYVERLFGVRADALRASDPARSLALGRAASGIAMAAAFTRWRSANSACGGALVWFLRDLWPGAGWGLLDDEAQPKAAFHALARVLQPLHLGVTDDGLNGLHLQLVNETAAAVDGAVEIALYRHGDTLLARERRPLTLAPRSTAQHALLDWLPGFMDLNWAYRFGPPATDLLVATLFDGDGRVLCETLHAASTAAMAQPAEIGLAADALVQPDGSVRVQVCSRAAAWGVHFEAHGWRADDEFFDLAPGAERGVVFTPVAGSRASWRATVNALNARSPVAIGGARAERWAAPEPARVPSRDRPSYPTGEGLHP